MLRKLEREQIASARRVERERIASEKAVAREQERQQRYWANARAKARERDIKLAERDLALAKEVAAKRAEFVHSTVGRGFGRVAGAARAVGTMGLAMTGIGGAALAASAISQAGDLDNRARRIAIAGRNPGGQGYDPVGLSKQFTQAGLATGVAPEQIAAGAANYQAITGDLDGALKQMKMLGTFTQATEAEVSQLAAITANFGKLGVTSIDDVAQALATFVFQGKKGSFELKNMASELPELLSQQAAFGAVGMDQLKQFGGLLQIVQKSTGNASETSTAVSNMFRQFMAKNKDFETGKAFGTGDTMNVFTDKSHRKLRDYRDIIPELISKDKGDIGKLNDQLEIRGSKAFNPFTTVFNSTFAEQKKGGATDKAADKVAQDAVRKLLDDASNVGGDFREIQRDATDAMKGFDVQMAMLSMELKSVVASELFPSFIKMAQELPRVIEPTRQFTGVMVKLAGALIDHPLLGLGGLIGTAVAYEVGKAALGKVLENGVARLFAGGGGKGGSLTSYSGGGYSKATGASGMGALGSVAVGATIGISLASVILTTGIVNFEKGEVNLKDAGESLNKVRNAGVDEIPMVQEEIKKTRAKLNEATKPGALQAFDEMLGFAQPGSKPGDGFGLSKLFESTVDLNAPVNRKTLESNLAEQEARLKTLEAAKAQQDAAKAQEAAAKSMTEAGAAIKAAVGTGKPNTGNSPSPVKG